LIALERARFLLAGADVVRCTHPNTETEAHVFEHLHSAGRRTTRQRLEKLAESTCRSRSFLAAEAITEYLAVQEWQVEGIKQAIASLDRGDTVPHLKVKDWVASWDSQAEHPAPKRSEA
jgi:RHH-type transcriptional regulator, rel operon repressor / antitoxin RelB